MASIHQFDASLPRALCWGAAWDMCRDAELAARDFVRLVLGGIGTETDPTALQQLLRLGQTAVRAYTSPAYRSTLAQQWAAGLLELAQAAEPGSDAQLAFVRGFGVAATTPEDAAQLRSWLDGTDVPTDLAVDADLRWSLHGHLAALGALEADEIEAELLRDPTITGHEKAAYARAARPDEDAKATAWDLAMHRDDVPNITQLHVVMGFNQAGQDELLRPYVDRYFAEIDGVWKQKDHDVAQNAVDGLFPHQLVVQETVDSADAWLAGDDHASALHRLVSEHRDGIARALRCQAKDAELD